MQSLLFYDGPAIVLKLFFTLLSSAGLLQLHLRWLWEILLVGSLFLLLFFYVVVLLNLAFLVGTLISNYLASWFDILHLLVHLFEFSNLGGSSLLQICYELL